MNSTFSPYKEKQLYCSKLLNKEPAMYETYKRMLKSQKYSYSNLNTSQASVDTINKPIEADAVTKKYNKKENSINVNVFSPKMYKYQNNFKNPHISYLGYLKKNGYTFPTEKRFKWQNMEYCNYPSGINTFPRQKKAVKNKNEPQKETKKRKKKCEPTAFINKSYDRTKRVINSEINEKDEDYINKRHKKYPNLNKFVNVSKDGMKSLIKKTPLIFNFRGIKMVRRSHSYDLNLFMKNYGLFQIPKNRKHYVGKDSVKDLFSINRCRSWDSYKEDKACRKFQHNLYINPINWHVNIYNNFYGKY